MDAKRRRGEIGGSEEEGWPRGRRERVSVLQNCCSVVPVFRNDCVPFWRYTTLYRITTISNSGSEMTGNRRRLKVIYVYGTDP